jgi:predicted N-acetyltransferase YhbS/uncharacterized protein YqeY
MAKFTDKDTIFRALQRGEIPAIWTIDRSEVIHQIYVHEAGQLVRKPAFFDVKGWEPGAAEKITPALLDCFDRGGWCWGAFAADKLVGVAILESKLIGPAHDQLQLVFLHVSQAYRQQGLGKELFERAQAEARVRGARWLYVSATPSENTVHFYQRRGCVLADPPDPELLALEPEDIHLVCPVSAAALDPLQLRTQMKADLRQAMKARQSATVATLRSILAAFDNAEAVPVDDKTPIIPFVTQSPDVPRKVLSAADIHQILQKEIADLHAASAEYSRLGQASEAERLQNAAILLAGYLP